MESLLGASGKAVHEGLARSRASALGRLEGLSRMGCGKGPENSVKRGRFQHLFHRYIHSSGNLGLCLTEYVFPVVILSFLRLILVIIYSMGKHDEAEMLQRNQLDLSERILGKDHPTTIWCVETMSEIFCRQKKFEQAESLLREQLLLRQQLPQGDLANVPDIGTLTIMSSLAGVLNNLEKNEESLFLFN